MTWENLLQLRRDNPGELPSSTSKKSVTINAHFIDVPKRKGWSVVCVTAPICVPRHVGDFVPLATAAFKEHF